jgi:hypothetical protein
VVNKVSIPITKKLTIVFLVKFGESEGDEDNVMVVFFRCNFLIMTFPKYLLLIIPFLKPNVKDMQKSMSDRIILIAHIPPKLVAIASKTVAFIE